MPNLVPSYPQPYRLFDPITGHDLLSGPAGEAGYGAPGLATSKWVMPDGRPAWYYPGRDISQRNRLSLGLQRTIDESPRYSYDDLFALMKAQGATDAQADIMAAIGLAESDGASATHNSTASTGDDSVGIWEINLLAHPQYRSWNLYDIGTNVIAAVEVSGKFTNYHPWTTYTSQAFVKFQRGKNSPTSSGGGSNVGSPPPVAEPGPPVTPPPQAPKQSTPSTAGPVRRAVDSFIGYIPSLFGIGTAIRDGVRAVLDPMADLIDSWIQILAGDIEGAITYAGNVAETSLTYASDLVDHAIEVADSAVHSLASLTGHLITDAINEATSLVHDAEHLADAATNALAHLTASLIRDAITEATSLVHDAEHLADAATSALAHLTAGLIRDAINEAESLVKDAEHLADAATSALAHLTAALIADALDEARSLVKDAEQTAAGALRALEDDVVDPIKQELRHLVDDVIGPAETVLKDLVKAAKWVAWIATQPFEEIAQFVDDMRNLTPADVVASVTRSAANRGTLSDAGIWGVPQ